MEAASSRASPETSATEDPPAAIVCEQCGVKFKRVQDLGKHLNRHKIDEEVEKLRKEQKGEQAGENMAVQTSDGGAQAKVLEEAREPEQAAEAKENMAVQTSDEVERDPPSRYEGAIGTCLFCMKFTLLQLAVDRSSVGRRISKSMRSREKQRQLAMARRRSGRSGDVTGDTDEAFTLSRAAGIESSGVNTERDRSRDRTEEEGAGIRGARTETEQHQLSAAQRDAGYSSNAASKVCAAFKTSAGAGYGRNKHRIDDEAITTKRMRMQRERRQPTATWSCADVAFDLNKANIISNSTDPGYVRGKHREYARTKKRAVADEFDGCNEELDLTLRL